MSYHSPVARWLVSSTVAMALAAHCFGQRPSQILYFRAPAQAPANAFLHAGSTLVAETELPRANFSKTFEIPSGNLELLFLPNPLEADATPPKGAPSVKIPESWQKVLMLVFQDKRNTTMPIRVRAIDASDHVFGPGDVYVANFSEIGVLGTVGDKKLRLNPKATEIIKNPIAQNGYYPAKLDKFIVGESKPQRFIRQMWGHDGEVRQVLFILPMPPPLHATYYCTPINGLDGEIGKKPDSN